MKIHGRLAPGLVRPNEELHIRIHLPRKLAGVTLKLWETDTFVGRSGPETRDPSGDRLLAQWEGDLEAGDGPTPNDLLYCRFTPTTTTITSDDLDAFALAVVLPGGSAPVVVPVGGERTELAARSVGLVLSVEQGGGELFRSTSSCVAQMPTTTVRFEHQIYLGRSEDGKLADDGGADDKRVQALTHQWVCFGLSHGDDMQARLEVVGSGWIGVNGIALESADDNANPIVVRKGRKLFAYIHERKVEFEKGVSKVPLAVCEPISAEGVVIAERPELADLLEIRIAEVPVDFGERARFSTDLSKLDATQVAASDEHLRAFSEAAKRFKKVT